MADAYGMTVADGGVFYTDVPISEGVEVINKGTVVDDVTAPSQKV